MQRESELDLSSYGLSYTRLDDLMDSILDVPGSDNYYGFSTYWHHVIDTKKPVTVIELKYLDGAARDCHAWNLVQIDGARYHVDATWDDPTPDRAGYVRYDHFLKSDDYMSRNHFNWTASPACTSTKYDDTDLPGSEEQQEVEQYNAILEACQAALRALPYQTEADLRAATTEELEAQWPQIDAALDSREAQIELRPGSCWAPTTPTGRPIRRRRAAMSPPAVSSPARTIRSPPTGRIGTRGSSPDATPHS